MKNEIPKEIILIYMRGLNLLPVARNFNTGWPIMDQILVCRQVLC